MTTPRTGALTREQAEAAAGAATAQRDTVQANLLDLDGSFGKRLLTGAPLAGESRKSWEAAAAALRRLWETFTAYSAVVDQAAELLARGRRPAGLAQADALLTGKSVRLPSGTSALAQRDLTGTGEALMTLDEAVRDMQHGFAAVAGVVTAAENVWNEVAGPVQDVADQLAGAKQQASGLTDEALGTALGTAEADLAGLRGLLNSDPLALWRGGHVDVARLERLRQRSAAAAARASELALLRADADGRIATVAAAVSAARAAWQDAMAARERATVKIVAPLPPLPQVAGLADRLAALDELKAAGRWTRLAAELQSLEKQAAATAVQCRTAQQDAVALLDQRDELRGMLDAYRARAARLGAIEDSGLEARYERARELLWTAPCDLSAAGDAVAGYQQAVRSLGGGRQP